MITVEEACRLVLLNTRSWGSEKVPLMKANGRVITESFSTDRPMPPFDRVTMDGIAIKYESYQKGQRIFQIDGIAQAGASQETLGNSAACLEVMTGAVMPNGLDTVIRYEDLSIVDDSAEITVNNVKIGQNIHRKGSDRNAQDRLLTPPRIVTPAEVNIAATIGKDEITVAKLPRTMVVSTGDELVEISEIPLPHQIRKSNVYMILSALQTYGIDADHCHLRDDKELISNSLAEFLSSFDLIILSGGVSAGKYDFVPKVLSELGVECHFHKVAQRPGKPIWFGSKSDGPVVFGLPGNPVSSLVGFVKYVKLWLDRSFGLLSPTLYCTLKEDIHFSKPLTYFGQVKVHYSEDGLYASPVLGRGSGDLANLLDADGFVELPRELEHFSAGQNFPIHLYRG